MRILQINSVYGFASTGKIVADIHEKLLNDGYESYVIYSRKEPKNATFKNVTKIYSPIGVAMHAALALFFDKHGLYSKHSTRKIINRIDEINPDIIHLHVIHGFYLNYPMLFDYIKKTNRKIVWTLHDCWEYTGYCAYYDYNECFEWKNGCKNCKYRNEYPYRLLSHSKQNFQIKKHCYEGVDMTLVSPSKWLDGEVSQSMMSNFKHQVIHNDVKLDHFYFEESNLRETNRLTDKRVLLCVANVWTEQKGFSEIIKLSKLIDKDTRIVMIGVSKKQQKNLPVNIIGIQRIDVNELRKWYSTADAFINCTLEDNYPTVNLEAKACGLPVISYRTGGSPEMLDSNDVVVDKYDISMILGNLKNVNRLEKNSVNTMINMVSSYKQLYDNILEEKNER